MIVCPQNVHYRGTHESVVYTFRCTSVQTVAFNRRWRGGAGPNTNTHTLSTRCLHANIPRRGQNGSTHAPLRKCTLRYVHTLHMTTFTPTPTYRGCSHVRCRVCFCRSTLHDRISPRSLTLSLRTMASSCPLSRTPSPTPAPPPAPSADPLSMSRARTALEGEEDSEDDEEDDGRVAIPR